MEYKILEQNGIENENVDGAGFNNFCASNEDLILKGILKECALTTPDSNSIMMDTGELVIKGFRIKITSPYIYNFSSTPATNTNYELVARIVLLADRNVSVEIICRTPQTLVQDDLFVTESGTYECVIATFVHSSNGIINLEKKLNISSGGTDGSLTEEEKAKLNAIDINGDGSKFLSNDGTYKEVGGGTSGGLSEEQVKELITQETTDFVKNTDYATTTTAGVVKYGNGLYVSSTGLMTVSGANKAQIDTTGGSNSRPITTNMLRYAVKVGLTNPETSGERAWTEEDKEKACETLGVNSNFSKKLYKHTIRLENPNTNEDFTFAYEPIFDIITQDASLGTEQIGIIKGSELYSLLINYFGVSIGDNKIALVPYITKDAPYQDRGMQAETTTQNQVIFLAIGSGHKLMGENDTLNIYITTRELGTHLIIEGE